MTPITDQEEIRRRRRQEMIDSGVEVYPARTKRTTTIGALLTEWSPEKDVVIVGRVRANRLQGGSAFLKLEDETDSLQIFLQKKNIEDFATITERIDLGDFLEVAGPTFVTKRGEKTVDARTVRWLAKALRPLPSEWHGLADVETRYRYRELDLLANEDIKRIFVTREKIIHAIHDFLRERDFLEVETPVLQAIAGGASAKPFVTHHHALDIDLYLRIAPELYLKRLIVGGMGRVYEISRNFRNEGIDRDHNPEFSEMECYAAFTDYHWMMELTEDLVIHLASTIYSKPEITWGKKSISLAKPFPQITYRQAILDATDIDIDSLSDEQLRQAAIKKNTDLKGKKTRGQILDEIFRTHVRPKMIEPTFVHDHPLELSPLAKKVFDNPKYTERFQLLMAGTEVANAFSELNDPVDQRERFMAQEKMRQEGDEEAQRIDETFIRSLEYGMPPTAGLGVGIDRLTAILTNQKALKDVILFPTLRPETND